VQILAEATATMLASLGQHNGREVDVCSLGQLGVTVLKILPMVIPGPLHNYKDFLSLFSS